MTMSATSDFHEQYLIYRQATAEAIRTNKIVVFEALSAAGITTVHLTFDGCGDSGQIEECFAQTNQASVEFPPTTVTMRSTSFEAEEFTLKEMPLREAVEEPCCALLEQEHDGWEINDGAFGEFTLDVSKRTVELKFNSRFTEIDTNNHTF
jgi:hypothetical protein